jgi:CheY-specific phosphatase CheX
MRVSEETLNSVGRDVLETVAFTIVVPGAAEKTPDEPLVRAAVTFKGPLTGTFCLAIPAGVAPALANNMLGRDEAAPATPQESQDAVGELANIMCGNVLSAVAGPAPVFDLGSPSPAAPDDNKEAPAGETTAVTLPLLNGYADLAITLNEND